MTGVPEIARRFIDGSWVTGVADDGGGGSQPLTKTLTAAEITARWDGGAFYSAIEWPEYDATALIVVETATTLDGDLVYTYVAAYDPGATTADVVNSGEVLSSANPPNPSTYKVAYQAINVVSGGTVEVFALLPGKSAYIVYQGGTTPPTTGTATIRALRLV